MGSTIIVEISDGIASITLNRPDKFNALTLDDYDAFGNAMRDIDKRDDVLVTVWQATGKWFCAGTDVKTVRDFEAIGNIRRALRTNVVHSTLDCGHAEGRAHFTKLYSHSKILVAALNGPVMGISASFLGYFDFIYALPNAWLSVPLAFVGLVTEGGASVSFVNMMGLSVANEVLIWGKKKTAQELLDCKFINKIFPEQNPPSFHSAVRAHLLDELRGLDSTAILATKKLIHQGLNEKNSMDAVNLRESYAQASRFASGVPQKLFIKLAKKEIRHKL